MFYRAAVERQGKGKNNETSEDKTKLSSTSSPLPCSFILTEPEAAGRWCTGWGPQSSRPSSSTHMSCAITSRSSHRSSCSFGFTIFILLCIWILLFIIQLLVFICVVFIRNCASLRVILFSWSQVFLHQRLMLLKNKQEFMSWVERVVIYIYTYISLHNTNHVSVMYFLWLLINIFVSFLYPCVSWVECFSAYDEINCSVFSGSSSIHWPNFWPRREGRYRKLGEEWSEKTPSRGDTITWVL